MNKHIALAALLAAVCTGCHHDHHEHHDEEQAEHHIETVMSAYSEDYELFAQAHPFVAGESTVIGAHITRLADFKPVSEGRASAVLEIQGSTVRAEADAPSRPGVWKFSITPAREGEGSFTVTFSGQTLSVPVTVYADEEQAHEAAEAAEPEAGNTVAFPKEQSWKMDFATQQIGTAPFGRAIKTVGLIRRPNGDEQIITAKASGIVHFIGTDLLPGDRVSAGQALFNISTAGMVGGDNLDLRLSVARSEYERAEGEYTRKSALAAKNIVSAADLSAARAEYESAKAEYENIASNYNGGKFAANSEKDGYVTGIFVKNGSFVEQGAPLAAVSGSGRLIVEARVPAKYASEVQGTTDANITAGGVCRSLAELRGRLLSVGRSVSAASPMLPVSFEIADTPGLVPGTFTDVYIKTVATEDAVCVPNEALVEEMGNFFVFRQLNPELFEKVQVRTGATDGIRTRIMSGLDGGERIVTSGAAIVRLAQTSGALDPHAGHVH